jgi:hypothetical protein
MFDEAGDDGIVCSDHMIYPREIPGADQTVRRTIIAKVG